MLKTQNNKWILHFLLICQYLFESRDIIHDSSLVTQMARVKEKSHFKFILANLWWHSTFHLFGKERACRINSHPLE